MGLVLAACIWEDWVQRGKRWCLVALWGCITIASHRQPYELAKEMLGDTVRNLF